MPTIYGSVRDEPELSTLLRCIDASGLSELLSGHGPNTLFAPSDEAFERLSIVYRARVLNDPGFVRVLVDNHIVAGSFTREGLHRHPVLHSNANQELPVRDIDGLRVSGATIRRTIACDNGLIHVLDAVIVLYEREDKLTA